MEGRKRDREAGKERKEKAKKNKWGVCSGMVEQMWLHGCRDGAVALVAKFGANEEEGEGYEWRSMSASFRPARFLQRANCCERK